MHRRSGLVILVVLFMFCVGTLYFLYPPSRGGTCAQPSIDQLYQPQSQPLLSTIIRSEENGSNTRVVVYKKKYLLSVLSVCEAKTYRKSMRYWLKHSAPEELKELYDFKFFIEKVRLIDEQSGATMDCLKELESEQAEHGDLIFLDLKPSEQGWYKLVHKVEKMFIHLLENYVDEYHYFIKLDDDSLVLMDQLNNIITTHERSFLQRSESWGYPAFNGKTSVEASLFLLKHYPLYAGYRYSGNVVQMNGFWENKPFYEATGLTQYTRYMSGGMYVLSNMLVKAIASSAKIAPLAKWTMEDATVGFWVTSYQSIWVHIGNILTAMSGGCNESGPMVLYHPIKEYESMKNSFDYAKRKEWNAVCMWVQTGVIHGTPHIKRS